MNARTFPDGGPPCRARRRHRSGTPGAVTAALLTAALLAGATTTTTAAAQDVPYLPIHLAIGTPGEDLDGARDAGAVTVMAGEPLSVDLIWDLDDYLPTPSRTRTFRQGADGLGDRPERGDRFGSAIVFGDFDDNGSIDLAIGVPGEDFGRRRDVGMVHVVAGRGFHFGGGPVTDLHRGVRGVAGRPDAGDRFGHALAVVDLNGDGYDDLAVGVPGDDTLGFTDAGAVQVFLGSRRGLTGRSTLLAQGQGGLADEPERADRFGSVLAGHSRSPVLVVGVPNEDIDGHGDAGAIQVIAPTRPWTEGLHTQRSLELLAATASDPGPETIAAGDRFGAAVAVSATGPRSFIVAGAPGEDVRGVTDAGSVLIADFGGPSTGSLAPQLQRLSQADRSIVGARPEQGDRFGSAIAAREGWQWFATPDEDTGPHDRTGAVHEPYSTFDQALAALPGENGTGDRFGASLAVSSRGLVAVIGVPGEDSGGVRDAGSIVWHSIDNNQNNRHWRRFDPDDVIGPGAGERGDRFGTVLAMN
jgi:hypothetical protein